MYNSILYHQHSLPATCFVEAHYKDMYYTSTLTNAHLYDIIVHWFINFCKILIYPSIVNTLPEDGHNSGRNM
jgi:hypothetical protein